MMGLITRTEGLLCVTKRLTNAQVIALPTTPVVLVPARDDVGLFPVAWEVYLDPWVADYTNIDGDGSTLFCTNGTLDFDSAPINSGDVLASGASKVRGYGMNRTGQTTDGWAFGGIDQSDIRNLPFSVACDNDNSGNFHGGDVGNVLVVQVFFRVMTFRGVAS